jgi:hypothetical protein
MKTTTTLIVLILTFVSLSARAQMQTLVVSPTSTNSAVITVSSNSFATIKSVNSASGGYVQLNLQGVNFAFHLPDSSPSGLIFSGPATMQLQGDGYGAALATVDVEPGPFPPGKALTVGANSGNVQVTMQMSTDLVTWTPAVNGMVYTNTPDARFFRIQMVVNAQGP